eukprot:7095750-Alexandrium_andersonii.AAC.1
MKACPPCPSSALAHTTSSAPAPAEGKLTTLRATAPRSFVPPALRGECTCRPVGALRCIVARS